MIRLQSIKRAPVNSNLDDALPTDAIYKGYGLHWYHCDGTVVLYKGGWHVYVWNYIPSITEVRERIRELEKDGKDAYVPFCYTSQRSK